jgi:hypothetical protein
VNEEQSKRLAEAAEAIMLAREALDEATDALDDRRFESENERERSMAAGQLGNRADAAAKRLDDAIRRATSAAAATGSPGAFERYTTARAAVREGRALAKPSSEQDSPGERRSRIREAVGAFERAFTTTARGVFR